MSNIKIDLVSCARCGRDHAQLEFASLANGQDGFTHWSLCPTSLQPVLLKMVEEGVEVRKGQVVKTKFGRKYVASAPHKLVEGDTIVCDTPHADGDFSYICGSGYCRCLQ
jgi:hypothetical protein